MSADDDLLIREPQNKGDTSCKSLLLKLAEKQVVECVLGGGEPLQKKRS